MWAALCSQGTWQGEVQERRKDASALTGWLVVNAVRDHAGQVVNYVGVLRDISRLRADEATIRKLSLAVEQSPTSIVITSTTPTIEYANPQFSAPPATPRGGAGCQSARAAVGPDTQRHLPGDVGRTGGGPRVAGRICQSAQRWQPLR